MAKLIVTGLLSNTNVQNIACYFFISFPITNIKNRLDYNYAIYSRLLRNQSRGSTVIGKCFKKLAFIVFSLDV